MKEPVWERNGHLAGDGKCQALTTVGADMLLEKGFQRESKMVICHAMVQCNPNIQWWGMGVYGKAYNKIVRRSD